jgi:hypothetical protein
MRPIDEGDPVGLKKEVSKELIASPSSCSASECVEGDGWRTDDSYELSVIATSTSGMGAASDDEDWLKVDKSSEVEMDDSVIELDCTVVC